MIYSLARISTTSGPLSDARDKTFLQEYVHELLSSFYFPKNITTNLRGVVKNFTSNANLNRNDVFNETIDMSQTPTDTIISSTVSPPWLLSLTNDDNMILTSVKSSGERTARQTTVMSSDITSVSNNEESTTFSPKPFYKATIERVTLKPKSKNFGIIKKTLSAALPESTYNIKISDRMTMRNSTDKKKPSKPQLMIGDLFHNSLDNDSMEENLIIYDMDYVKWLFNIFYEEMKKKNLASKVTFTKVHKVFLNMLAEIGNVRSKWLNKSMARHYATHFERKRYDNEKRKLLSDEDLSYASRNIHSLLAQYFDPNERISSDVPLSLPPIESQIQNFPQPSQDFDKDMSNKDRQSPVNSTPKYPKITVEWSRPDRVQSIPIDIQHYGGVSRNSGSFPKISFRNDTQKTIHNMEEYSMAKNAIARDIYRLIGSISSTKDNNSNSSSKFSSSTSPSSMSMQHLPKEISQLLVDTIKRSA